MTTERLTPLTDLESDALAELANVAMARASVSLRTMIQHEVLLSVPTVEILAPKEAIARVAKPGNPNLVAVRQDSLPSPRVPNDETGSKGRSLAIGIEDGRDVFTPLRALA